jgi:Rrf2 family protein
MVSQKCQYALRAIFELAKRQGTGPVKIADIASVQAIPTRFLEVILSQLKQAGFVESRRGTEGGYLLSVAPAKLTVGEVIRFIEGPLGPVDCGASTGQPCSLKGDCVFLPMWRRVEEAVREVYDSTTFADLIDDEKRMCSGVVREYSI